MPPDNRASFDDLVNAPTSLPVSAAIYTPEQVNRLLEDFSRVTAENDQLHDEVRKLKRQANTSAILDQLIEPYARKTYWFMVGYCSFVGGMIYLSGLHGSDIHIDDEVLKILVGSTAVTVIGLVGMILTGVFVGARKS